MRISRREALSGGIAALSGCLGVPIGHAPAEYSVSNHALTDWSKYQTDWKSPNEPPSTTVKPTPVLTHLEIPWDLTFAPNGDLFITERTGRVIQVDGTHLSTVTHVDDAIDTGVMPSGPDEKPYWDTWFLEGGEGGLLGVALHPEYPNAPYLYVYYTRKTWFGFGAKENTVARLNIAAKDPAATREIVIDGIPAGTVHNGGRIAFGPANYLWVTTGDSGKSDIAQNEQSLGGKVLRVDAAGNPAPDNPSVSGRDRRIYTLGHRNPQGLAWLPDGTPLVTEHGTSGLDEVSILKPGANYGWPRARTAAEYEQSDYYRPLVSTPAGHSWAPSGCVFYTGEAIPSWTNRLLVATLFAQRLQILTPVRESFDRSTTDDGTLYDADWLDDSYDISVHSTLTNVLGRLRAVEQGPDGRIYLLTSNRDGRAKSGFPRPVDDVLVRLDAS